MTQTIIKLLVLNTANPTNTWDLHLGFALMAYLSAVQTSTGFTPHFLMYGRGMQLLIDIMSRSPNHKVSRPQYAQEVRNILENAYSAARKKLHMVYKRKYILQYTNTNGIRYSVGISVWLWSNVPTKKITPKCHEP